MRCAVVELATCQVLAIIEADLADTPPPGALLARIGISGLSGPGVGVGFNLSNGGYSMTVSAADIAAAIAAEDAPPEV